MTRCWRARARSILWLVTLASLDIGCAQAQTVPPEASAAAPYGAPVEDQSLIFHAELDQFEEQLDAGSNDLRWDGEAWVGTDETRLWFKSEGYASAGQTRGGQDEALYDRPVTTFFDLQAGVRYDLDSFAGRAWGAIGLEGLAPYNLKVSATVYASDAGHYAMKITAAYEALLTQRLILEPQIELNGYTRPDKSMQVASGWSQLDAGLRLRYEIRRKIAPYLGIVYSRSAPGSGINQELWRVAAGLRVWF
ncbi:MAG: copper resistance protein B [Steroidobacteraceae bacterium]|jgi:copper resistance protein B